MPHAYEDQFPKLVEFCFEQHRSLDDCLLILETLNCDLSGFVNLKELEVLLKESREEAKNNLDFQLFKGAFLFLLSKKNQYPLEFAQHAAAFLSDLKHRVSTRERLLTPLFDTLKDALGEVVGVRLTTCGLYGLFALVNHRLYRENPTEFVEMLKDTATWPAEAVDEVTRALRTIEGLTHASIAMTYYMHVMLYKNDPAHRKSFLTLMVDLDSHRLDAALFESVLRELGSQTDVQHQQFVSCYLIYQRYHTSDESRIFLTRLMTLKMHTKTLLEVLKIFDKRARLMALFSDGDFDDQKVIAAATQLKKPRTVEWDEVYLAYLKTHTVEESDLFIALLEKHYGAYSRLRIPSFTLHHFSMAIQQLGEKIERIDDNIVHCYLVYQRGHSDVDSLAFLNRLMSDLYVFRQDIRQLLENESVDLLLRVFDDADFNIKLSMVIPHLKALPSLDSREVYLAYLKTHSMRDGLRFFTLLCQFGTYPREVLDVCRDWMETSPAVEHIQWVKHLKDYSQDHIVFIMRTMIADAGPGLLQRFPDLLRYLLEQSKRLSVAQMELIIPRVIQKLSAGQWTDQTLFACIGRTTVKVDVLFNQLPSKVLAQRRFTDEVKRLYALNDLSNRGAVTEWAMTIVASDHLSLWLQLLQTGRLVPCGIDESLCLLNKEKNQQLLDAVVPVYYDTLYRRWNKPLADVGKAMVVIADSPALSAHAKNNPHVKALNSVNLKLVSAKLNSKKIKACHAERDRCLDAWRQDRAALASLPQYMRVLQTEFNHMVDVMLGAAKKNKALRHLLKEIFKKQPDALMMRAFLSDSSRLAWLSLMCQSRGLPSGIITLCEDRLKRFELFDVLPKVHQVGQVLMIDLPAISSLEPLKRSIAGRSTTKKWMIGIASVLCAGLIAAATVFTLGLFPLALVGIAAGALGGAAALGLSITMLVRNRLYSEPKIQHANVFFRADGTEVVAAGTRRDARPLAPPMGSSPVQGAARRRDQVVPLAVPTPHR